MSKMKEFYAEVEEQITNPIQRNQLKKAFSQWPQLMLYWQEMIANGEDGKEAARVCIMKSYRLNTERVLG